MAFLPAAPARASGGTTTGADIQVSGSSNLGSTTLGQEYTYTYQVKNAGPQAASPVTFTDDLTAGTLVTAAVGGDSSLCTTTADGAGGTAITCTMSIVSGGGANVTLTVDAPATATGSFANTGSATSALTDPNTANNSFTVTIKTDVATCSSCTIVPIGTTPPPTGSGGGSTTTTTTGGGGGTTTTGGGGGGTTTTLSPGACGTIIPKGVSDTHVDSTLTMQAQVTSCSQVTQVVQVNWDGNNPGYPGQPPGTHYWEGNLFTCGPVYITLSPGASSGVTCNVVANGLPTGWTDSGEGTATAIANGTPAGAATVLDSELYPWSIAIPLPPGGGSGNQCTRTTCIF